MLDRQDQLLREFLLSIRDLEEPTPCEGRQEIYDAVDGMAHLNRAAELIAKRLCDTCPLKLKCLTYAIEAKESSGVWGGLNTQERNLLTKQKPSLERQ